MQPAPQEISTCSNCGGVLEETPGGGLGCMSCLLRAGIGSEGEVAKDSTPTAFEDGGRFGVYEIDCHPDGSLYELGRGAMGVTYRATDTSLQRKVALKIIKIDIAERSADARERFMREARAAAALRHENIATVHQFGMRLETGQYFYAMELIEGETLEERVRRGGPLDARTTIKIAQQVTSALAAAEKHGLVHRDLKPANLMLVFPDGETPHVTNDKKLLVKIIDFGLAKAIHAQIDPKSLTHDRFVGTPAFASPEQFEHAALDVRSDIYSLGETLWFALTGKTPFGGRSVDEIHGAQKSNVLPIEQLKAAHVPSRLRLLLESMLALEPASRPGTHELAARLQRCSPEARSVRRTRFALAVAAIVILGMSALFVFQPSRIRNSPLNPDKSIAVLPFENRSEDKANAYFADGIQDEILTRLSKIADLKVISRTSTQQYQSRPANLREIAKQLGVTNFLEGSVQKVGERVRINVQLIRAGANDHLWAEMYDRNLADIFAVQSEVATAIANTLLLKLTGHERTAVAQKPTDNLAAYDAYLRGLDLSSRPSQALEDQIKAADQFEEAVRLDPRFAQAWAALSQVDSYLYILRQVAGGSQRAERARSAAETATRLDPSSPETLLANAYYRYEVQRDYQSARVLFEKIHEQVPSNSQALVALARVARRQNRWKDSLRLFEEAAKLNPRDISLLTDRAMTFLMLRQPAAAHEMIDRALAINPDDFELLVVKARLFQWESNLPAAKSVLDKLASTPQTDGVVAVQVDHLVLSRSYEEAETLLLGTLAKSGSRTDLEQAYFRESLGRVQSLAGKKEKAQQTYLEAKSELEAVQREQPTSPWVAGLVGSVEAGLGNKEAALREGERGVSLWPASEDPVYGPAAEENLAGIEALVDEPDRALALIERLVTTPYGSYPLNQAGLRLDPTWDRLRSHPRFKAIVEGPEPKTIYH